MATDKGRGRIGGYDSDEFFAGYLGELVERAGEADGDEAVSGIEGNIEAHRERPIALVEAVNHMAERYNLATYEECCEYGCYFNREPRS